MLIRPSPLCTVFFNLSQLFRVLPYWQALWMWSFLSWSCLHICWWQIWVFSFASLLGRWMDLDWVYWGTAEPSVPSVAMDAAQWGMHMALDCSQAEPIAWHFSAAVNSLGQCPCLAVLLGKLLLSWLKKQLICPIIRNTSTVHFIRGPWPWNMRLVSERDGSLWEQTEGQLMVPFWLAT